ncbi:MAG: type II toxin-antitoxin system RelE/ParE family toxin [Myxococcales bacterium]|nr:type II toxin-antitoxin system RelE/ParE family toxin [Myxococcales bacterium]
MPKLKILDEAAREVEATAAYIEEQRTGHGLLFVDAYENKLAQIERLPASGPLLMDVVPGYELRSFWIRKFGYSIIVGVIEEVPTIIAVMHHSREPGYWQARLTKPKT